MTIAGGVHALFPASNVATFVLMAIWAKTFALPVCPFPTIISFRLQSDVTPSGDWNCSPPCVKDMPDVDGDPIQVMVNPDTLLARYSA